MNKIYHLTETEKAIVDITLDQLVEDFSDAQLEDLLMLIEVHLREKRQYNTPESKL